MKRGGDAAAQKRTTDAITSFQQALVLNPGSPDALLGLAEATERNGNQAEAVKAYSQLTAANPAEIRGWLGLMRTQINSKDPAAVLETAQRIPAPARQKIEQRPRYVSQLALDRSSRKRQA